MSIKTLVFDFGNVIGFFSHQRATQRLLPHAHMDAGKLHLLLHEGELARHYERGTVTTDQFRVTVKKTARLECGDDYFDEAYGDIFWRNEGLCALLPQLAQRYPLLLLSNTNDLHARRFRVAFAEPLGLFQHTVLSHEIGLR